MALTDIDFNEGEGQAFLVETPVGILHAPQDILVETGSDRYLLLETPLMVGGDGDIFIMND